MATGMKNIARIIVAGLLAAATACRVEYHPYDTRISGGRHVNARNIAHIEQATAGHRQLRVAVISDTQRWYDETRRAVDAINALPDIDFVIHAGDLSDFGMRAEFERQRDILDGLRVPYVVLLGNHDCLGTGYAVFNEIFGPENFAFTAGSARFICLNTNALEFDHTHTVPDFGFLGAQMESFPAEAAQSVVAMHVQPYSEQFDNGVAQIFHAHVRALPGIRCCIHGHGHNYREEDIFGDGILYYQCESTGNRGGLLFTFDEQGYSHERFAF